MLCSPLSLDLLHFLPFELGQTAPHCGQPSQPRWLVHLHSRFGNFAETKEVTPASEQRDGLRDAWEEGAEEHYRHRSVSINFVSGDTRHDQRVKSF